MPLTPIFHPQEDWYQAMVTKNKGSLKSTNRQEEWYEEIVDSMASGGLPDTTSASFGDVLTLNNNKEAVWTTPSSGGGVLVVHDVVGTLDKTWQEIHDAMLVGYVVIAAGTNSLCVIGATFDGRAETYRVLSCNITAASLRAYSTDSASGYPALQ